MQPSPVLSLHLSHSLDDVEPHLSSLRWHRALPKDEREKWDKRAGREKEGGEGEGWEKVCLDGASLRFCGCGFVSVWIEDLFYTSEFSITADHYTVGFKGLQLQTWIPGPRDFWGFWIHFHMQHTVVSLTYPIWAISSLLFENNYCSYSRIVDFFRCLKKSSYFAKTVLSQERTSMCWALIFESPKHAEKCRRYNEHDGQELLIFQWIEIKFRAKIVFILVCMSVVFVHLPK